MNRFASKAREEERKKINELATQTSSKIIESNEETITKLLAGKIYEKEDIINCAHVLLEEYGYNSDQQFRLVESVENFDEMFGQVTIEIKKPIFVIFGKPKNRWILLCIIKNEESDRIIILFKDPCGALVSFSLQKKLEEKLSNIKFIVQSHNDQKVEDEKSYGPLTVRNLKILLEFLKTGQELPKFRELVFSQLLHLNKERVENVGTLTAELESNEEFKAALKKFIDKLPLELASGMLEYKSVMEEELEKDEEHVDFARIKEARQKYLSAETVKKIENDFKLNSREENNDIKGYELEIQKNFPLEMKKLGDIFQVFDNIKIDAELYKTLKGFSDVLGIDYRKMKIFYELKASQEATKDEKLTPDDINEIVNKAPQMEAPSVLDCTSLEELLKEVVLGMDREDASPRQQNAEEIKKIEEKYFLVKNKYEIWKTSDLRSINSWATQIKNNLGTTDEAVCEAIAIMDRALNLLTGGHRLRDSQILAVLIFFHGENNKGRLCQIKTGEGKTIIVSILAVIKVLQGHTVDVITSNSILAADGVDETKTFFSTFGLTVSTNNPDGKSDFKIGYQADVLYGTISNFQFDFLKDSFEGFNIRRERKFGQVILDEVDSMLVDNGGHIAKLASPYPGMECLRYIYVKIWQELHKAEESFARECQEKIKEFFKYSKDEAQRHYREFLQEMILNERKIVKEKIRASNPIDVPLIPAHLKGYVNSKLDVWIKNALHAKYNCHEHQQYRLTIEDSGEKVITPVDYLNTGVTMKNTIWSNGLHQFVQLKHNLYLTFESLTSSFISNIGYIKKYDDKNIFGLTGTLGSRAEQELLSHIYNVDYAKIPTYKTKKFEELPGVIVDDDRWSVEVSQEALAKVDEKRAVLVICETEQDLLTVRKDLECVKKDFRIRLYANEDNAEETNDKVKIGDVILATNIAGRGTNFRTEKSLEENGGLHVSVGFLPCNLRVEGQAFGRTSRQGNNGTAQLIIRQNEVKELCINKNTDFVRIKGERDRLERDRLTQINNVLVKELNFKDELFGYFSDFYRNLKQVKRTESYRYILQDLKEFWAFWLEKKNFKAATIINTTPRQEFDNFLTEAKTIIDETISHNPYYCVALGNYYLEKNDRLKATVILNHAIDMGGPQNHELLAGAHFKLFELAIQSGDQVRERFKKAVAKIFFVDVKKNDDYRKKASSHLREAEVSVQKEIVYIEKYFNETNPDFVKILKEEEENIFLKHLNSRLFCLKVHQANIEEMLKMVESLPGGIDFSGKAHTNLNNFGKMSTDSVVKKCLTGSEMLELQAVGIDAIYSLREIHDVSNVVIYTAQGQIIAGIAALCVGLAFLPIFPLMGSIAGTLISEGIIDIVMEIVSKGNSEFDSKDFMKGKFISYGISLITFGISAITQSVKILSKAVSFCRKLSVFLRKSPYLKTLCNKLASWIDNLGDILEKMLATAKFNKLSVTDQLDELKKMQGAGNVEMFERLGGLEKMKDLQKLANLSKSQTLVHYTGQFVWKTTKTVGFSLVENLVLKPLLIEILQKLIDNLRHSFQNALRNSIKRNENLMRKLQTTPRDQINNATDEFLEDNSTVSIFKEVGFKLVGLLESGLIGLVTTSIDAVINGTKIEYYCSHFSSHLERTLQGGDCDNIVDDIIEEICFKVADKMMSLCTEIVEGYVKIGADWGKQKFEEFANDGEKEALMASGHD